MPGFHYFPQLPLLVRIAIEAEGLARGTHVTLLPLHNPVELAEIGAFLDLITQGKFLLGVGLGYRPEEFAALARRKTRKRSPAAVNGMRRSGAMVPRLYGARFPCNASRR